MYLPAWNFPFSTVAVEKTPPRTLSHLHHVSNRPFVPQKALLLRAKGEIL